MTEENKDLLIKDLKSDRKRLLERLRNLELEYDDLNEKYDDLTKSYHDMCENCNSLMKRLHTNYSEGFKNGQEDFQIKAKKILDTFEKWEADELVDVFGVTTNIELLNDIKTNYEKIMEYEKKKIHVGDEVVDNIGKKHVVRLIEGDLIYVWASNGESYVFGYWEVSKTGKHYCLDEILKELE